MTIKQEELLFFVKGCEKLFQTMNRHSEILQQIKNEVSKTQEELNLKTDREREIAGAIASHIFVACDTIIDSIRRRDPDFYVDVKVKLKYYETQYKRNIHNAKRLRALRALEKYGDEGEMQELRRSKELRAKSRIDPDDETTKLILEGIEEAERKRPQATKPYPKEPNLTPTTSSGTRTEPHIVIDPKTGRKVQLQEPTQIERTGIPSSAKMDDEDGTASMKDIKPGEDVI